MLFPSIQRVVAVCLLVAAVVAFPHIAVSGDVLFLHSESGPTVWTRSLADGLVLELGSDSIIHQEYVGGPGLDEDHFDTQFERLETKYAGVRPDAVVTSGLIAFAFMRKYRGLFGHAPVLFCGMPRPAPAQLAQCGECSGVPLVLDVVANVDLLFLLRPETRLVVGIMDGSPGSRKLRRRLEVAMEPYTDRAQLLFPGFEPGDDAGLTMESLKSVASSIPGSGAVIFLGFSEAASGRSLDQAMAVDLLSRRSAGPVLVLTDDWIGSGVLGGVVAQGRAHGQAVAGLVARVRAGERASEMLPQPLPGRAVLDGTVMARFGVTGRPRHAQFVNEPDQPEEAQGVAPSGVLGWLAGLVAFGALLLGVRRFYRAKM